MTKKTVVPILLVRGDDSVRVGESSFIVQAPKMLNEQKANSLHVRGVYRYLLFIQALFLFNFFFFNCDFLIMKQ
jgi:hypothetical protein